MSTTKSSEVNYYEVLDIDIEAQEAEIRKAYRKKALACHPDKNPDNPKAAELFHELSKALEILTDISARAAYDKVLKARKAAELRHKQLDSKRQKLKDNLERRELEAFYKPHVQKTDQEILQEEIERIRREGSRLLEEEHRLLREQLQRTYAEQAQPKTTFNSAEHRIKIKWEADKMDASNGGYSEEKLMGFLKKWGDIEALVMSKKKGKALVEFKTLEAGEMALLYEKGLGSNPLCLKPLNPSPDKRAPKSTLANYEDLAMRKLRQAEERKRLIEQMLKEDSEQA
ncbi:dnaJ homolog subfamily C member 17 [Glossina fuscipes]|uniref:DnaJ homolog subfamily C member 17 n=1 Tax=Glossina fuscipes TaxID=7396 RepID=A0A9C5ZG43_9MUSC|nr:dnaJ homolog subfamily C member 17 [Glossina fuscipes]